MKHTIHSFPTHSLLAGLFLLLNSWFAFPAAAQMAGDTLSIHYPQIATTTVKKQLTQTEYYAQGQTPAGGTYTYERANNSGWGGGGRNNYNYYYTYTTYDTTWVALAQNGSSVTALTRPISDKSGLWRAVKATDATGTYYRYQNLSSGQWLTWTLTSGEVTFSVVAQENQAKPFGIESPAANPFDYAQDGHAYYVPTVESNGTKYYFACTEAANSTTTTYRSSGRSTYYTYTTTTTSYRFSTGTPSSFDYTHWTQTLSNAAAITARPDSKVFGYAADAAAATAQKSTITFRVSLTGEVYLYDLSGQNQNHIVESTVTTTDPQALTAQGLSVTLSWASNGTDKTNRSSNLTAANIDNSLSNTAGYTESARTMMSLDQATISGQSWTVEVTPVGKSPLNIVSTLYGKKTQSNYVDDIVCEVTDAQGTLLGQGRAIMSRKAYHHRSVDELDASITPAYYIFDSPAGSNQFSVSLTHRNGEALYDAEDNIAEGGIAETALTMADLDACSFRITDEDLNTCSWASVTAVDNTQNTLTVSVTLNSMSTTRDALLISSFRLGTASLARQNTIRQRSANAEGAIKFISYKGVGNSKLDANGRQEVHEIETTIYYKSGEQITLTPNETAFKGYMRWYDYASGKDPRYAADGTDNAYFWVKKPQTYNGRSNSDFTSINEDGTTSHGLYATYASGLNNTLNQAAATYTNNLSAIIRGWSDAQSRDIACDVSAYTDYVITTTSVQEPTLSYRQIFHLRPAAEIAAALSQATATPYESYHYIAPTGIDVLLTTRFTPNNYGNTSDRCYFYYNAAGTLTQLGVDATGAWYKNGTRMSNPIYTNQYLKVSSTTLGTDTYELRIPAAQNQTGQDLIVARFEVEFVAPATYGPSTTALVTDDYINNYYLMLKKQDFNFGAKPGTTDVTFYSTHLPWEESTYGFFYPNSASQAPNRQSVSNDFVFYGEYALINRINVGWAVGEQHGGAANGYCLYVDGKQNPGLVATVTTNATICSGQQLYCYAWINNSCPANAAEAAYPPIFRFNVQGRNTGDTEWNDVGVFYAGKITAGKGWQQVCFPVVSANDYEESRICVYNFAESNTGNDFLIDDICLFASKLPLSAYQALTTCVTDKYDATIARVDYKNLTIDQQCKYLYYQLYNMDSNKGMAIDYYYPADYTGNRGTTYGVIRIPETDYDPSQTSDPTYRNAHCIGEDESALIYTSVSDMVKSMQSELELSTTGEQEVTYKGYVKTTENGVEHYVLYIGHLMKKDRFGSGIQYELRMANDTTDLSNPECAMRASLSMFDSNSFSFNGETGPTVGACANGLYPVTIDAHSQEELPDGTSHALEARAKADWLVGFSFDDIYRNATQTDAEKALADSLFKAKYGYTRGEIQDAIVLDMRNPTSTNPNWKATSFSELQADKFSKQRNYEIVKDLYEKGYLELWKDSTSLYLGSQDTVRYWIFPVVGTAKTTNMNGDEVTIDGCSDASFLCVFSQKNDYGANVSPIPDEQMPDEYKGVIPRVRVSASKVNTAFTVPLSNIRSVIFGWDSCQVISSTDPVIATKLAASLPVTQFSMRYTQDVIYQDVNNDPSRYYQPGDWITFRPIDAAHVAYLQSRHNGDKTLYPNDQVWGTGKPGFQFANTDTMRAGYHYTMRLSMLTTDYNKQIETGCPIGDVYFTVIVVPDTMIWTPTVDNNWGDDRNWRAVIDGVTQSYGYAPLPETMVIIPELTNKELNPYLIEENLYPMDAHYTSVSCRKVQFRKHTALLNQYLLSYDEAYIDMSIPRGGWYTMSAPLQGVYSGDFFIPHTGDYRTGTSTETDLPFVVSPFSGTRYQTAAYACYSTFYNESVPTVHEGGSTSTSSYTTNSLSFVQSNALDNSIAAGSGLELKVLGPNTDSNAEATIRLPKSDTRYYYWNSDGTQSSQSVSLARTNSHRFAFSPDANGDMTLTLTNATSSAYFLFGNPTMAYIDMVQFCADNAAVIEPSFQYMEGGTWITRTTATLTEYADRFIAPMQSVLLRSRTEATSLQVVVKSTQLSVYTNNSTTNSAGNSPKFPNHSRTNSENGHYLRNEVMHITAYTPRESGSPTPYAWACADVALVEFANNRYEAGEDVPFISSGIEAGNTNSYSAPSPLNLYTLADDAALMADIRQDLGIIPLGLLASDKLRYKSYSASSSLSSPSSPSSLSFTSSLSSPNRSSSQSAHLIAEPAPNQAAGNAVKTNEQASSKASGGTSNESSKASGGTSNESSKASGGTVVRYDSICLAFELSDSWSEECYLYDAVSGSRQRIMNGTCVQVALPANHELRYYIQKDTTGNEDTPTDNGAVQDRTTSGKDCGIKVFCSAPQQVSIVATSAIRRVRLYDTVGQLLLTYTPSSAAPVCTIEANSGIAIAEVELTNGMKRQAVVLVW